MTLRSVGRDIKVGLSLAALSLPLISGCDKSAEAPAPLTETKNYSVVDSRNNAYDKVLNQWLAEHPGFRVTGLAGVLSYRDDCSAFVVQHVPGNGKAQFFHLIDARHDAENPSSWEGKHGVKELQDWREAHPSKAVVTFTSIPSYSGGVKGWVICAENKD